MDLHPLKLQLQGFFTDGLLIVVGSGLSAAEGLMGMPELSNHLRKEVPNGINDADLEKWNEIDGYLEAGLDLENALLKAPLPANLEALIVNLTAGAILSHEAKIIEEVIGGSRILRFTRLLDHVIKPNSGVQIVTTNYDRLLEVASERAGLGADTMFVGHTIGYLNETESRYSFRRSAKLRNNKIRFGYSKRACIYKPHGSLDWYLHNDGPIRCPFLLDLPRLLITPGLNKFRTGYEQPFDRHISRANIEVDRASRYLIIGYGFNEDHLETHLRHKLNEGRPALVLTRSLSDNAVNLIQQSKNMISITAPDDASTPGAIIHIDGNEINLDGTNLWDLGDFIREVLEP